MMVKIPVSDLKPEIEAHWGEINEAIQKVLRDAAFIHGPDVKKFEDEASSYLGVKHSLGLNSGTDALVLGLKALGIGPGDEVITSDFSFFATAESISLLGAIPVFVDIDEQTFNIDVAKIEEKITSKTRAIVPVHLYGHAAEMDEILAIAEKYHLKVLEDVAQAFSGKFRSQMLGTIGHAGAFSFFPSKNLGAFGDGGMLSTQDDQIAQTVSMLRVHGAQKKYFNEIIGYNSRLDTIQAAILRIKLRYIDSSTEGRRRAAQFYNEGLAGIESIVRPTEQSYAFHSYHQYTVRVLGGQRNVLQAKLADCGIQTMIYYPHPLHRLPPYQKSGRSIAKSVKASEEVLSLPIWPEIAEATVSEVVDSIKRALI